VFLEVYTVFGNWGRIAGEDIHVAMILEEHKEVMRIRLYIDNNTAENKHSAP
jgi:hypothetical protein